MDVILNLDRNILQFIQTNMRNSIMDQIMPVITSLGSRFSIWMVIGIICIINKKYRKYGILVISSLVLCFVVGNLTLKPLVARVRPFDAMPILDVLLITPPKDFSFPSGHTMCSFAPAVVIFYMNRRFGIMAIIFSFLIGFSRLYLYVHYPSDVFGGMLIGILLGIISILLFKYIEKQNPKITKNELEN